MTTSTMDGRDGKGKDAASATLTIELGDALGADKGVGAQALADLLAETRESLKGPKSENGSVGLVSGAQAFEEKYDSSLGLELLRIQLSEMLRLEKARLSLVNAALEHTDMSLSELEVSRGDPCSRARYVDLIVGKRQLERQMTEESSTLSKYMSAQMETRDAQIGILKAHVAENGAGSRPKQPSTSSTTTSTSTSTASSSVPPQPSTSPPPPPPPSNGSAVISGPPPGLPTPPGLSIGPKVIHASGATPNGTAAPPPGLSAVIPAGPPPGLVPSVNNSAPNSTAAASNKPPPNAWGKPMPVITPATNQETREAQMKIAAEAKERATGLVAEAEVEELRAAAETRREQAANRVSQWKTVVAPGPPPVSASSDPTPGEALRMKKLEAERQKEEAKLQKQAAKLQAKLKQQEEHEAKLKEQAEKLAAQVKAMEQENAARKQENAALEKQLKLAEGRSRLEQLDLSPNNGDSKRPQGANKTPTLAPVAPAWGGAGVSGLGLHLGTSLVSNAPAASASVGAIGGEPSLAAIGSGPSTPVGGGAPSPIGPIGGGAPKLNRESEDVEGPGGLATNRANDDRAKDRAASSELDVAMDRFDQSFANMLDAPIPEPNQPVPTPPAQSATVAVVPPPGLAKAGVVVPGGVVSVGRRAPAANNPATTTGQAPPYRYGVRVPNQDASGLFAKVRSLANNQWKFVPACWHNPSATARAAPRLQHAAPPGLGRGGPAPVVSPGTQAPRALGGMQMPIRRRGGASLAMPTRR